MPVIELAVSLFFCRGQGPGALLKLVRAKKDKAGYVLGMLKGHATRRDATGRDGTRSATVQRSGGERRGRAARRDASGRTRPLGAS